MKKTTKNEQGYVMIGAVVFIIVIMGILTYVIQNNMSIFLANFNHNKAYYDAEVAVEKLSIELKNAYDLRTAVLNSNLALDPSNVRLNTFYYEYKVGPDGKKLCTERADGNFEPICLSFDADSIQVEQISTITWQERWQAFRYAIFKLINDMSAPSVAQAQEYTVFRPQIPNNAPTVSLKNNWPAADINDDYGQFNCLPHGPNWLVKDCVTFRICTKLASNAFSNTCKDDEFVYQTVLFSRAPRTDLED